MENQPTLAGQAAVNGRATIADIRLAVIGPRKRFEEIAEAMGCSGRAIYLLVDKFRIPYIKVLNRRYVDPSDIQKALMRDEANTPARGPGRPRKAA